MAIPKKSCPLKIKVLTPYSPFFRPFRPFYINDRSLVGKISIAQYKPYYMVSQRFTVNLNVTSYLINSIKEQL